MYGFYTIAKTNDERNRQKLEDRRMRYAMSVLLKTESDREYLSREEIYLKQEREIMKDVKGWRVGESPYYSNKFAKRAVDPLKYS
jgi:NADH dehydrogenase (ubiquinone) 1 alpha subcomplex subunit 13